MMWKKVFLVNYFSYILKCISNPKKRDTPTYNPIFFLTKQLATPQYNFEIAAIPLSIYQLMYKTCENGWWWNLAIARCWNTP